MSSTYLGLKGVNDTIILQLRSTNVNASDKASASQTSSSSNVASLFSFTSQANVILNKMQVHSVWNSIPRFQVTKFPSGDNEDVIVSFPTYFRMIKTLQKNLPPNIDISSLQRLQSLPLSFMLLKLHDNATNDQKDCIVRTFQAVLKQIGNDANVYDYRNVSQPLDTAGQLLNFLFVFTVAIAMFICFFSLMSSMYTNIIEQSKEIGVLLAIGIKKSYMKRIYTYEAFILVFSASFLGIIIGVSIAWTQTLQTVLFTQLPVPIIFPFMIVIAVFILSIIFALMASLGPVSRRLKVPVITLLK